MNAEEIQKLTEVVTVKPGDVVIYKAKKHMPHSVAESTYRALKHAFPRNEVLICGQDSSLSIFRPDEKTKKRIQHES